MEGGGVEGVLEEWFLTGVEDFASDLLSNISFFAGLLPEPPCTWGM